MPPIKPKDAKILAALGLSTLSGCDVVSACLSVYIEDTADTGDERDTADTGELEDTSMTPCLSPREDELQLTPKSPDIQHRKTQQRDALRKKLNQEGILPDDLD